MAANVYNFVDPFIRVTLKMPRNKLKARDIRNLVALAFGVDETSAHAGRETEEKDCVTYTVHLSPDLADMARCILHRKRYLAAVVILTAIMGAKAEVKSRSYVYPY